jgi:very-short-patch-repair endonuclease
VETHDRERTTKQSRKLRRGGRLRWVVASNEEGAVGSLRATYLTSLLLHAKIGRIEIDFHSVREKLSIIEIDFRSVREKLSIETLSVIFVSSRD